MDLSPTVAKIVKSAALILTLAALVLLSGCKREDPVTPTACREGAEVFLTALKSAPEDVRLSDGSGISDCLVPAQEAGPLADVGQGLLESANELNREARQDPGGQANVALGYLLGAAREGASDTSGIHTDLVRRLEAAVSFHPSQSKPSPAFGSALEEGIAAGEERG